MLEILLLLIGGFAGGVGTGIGKTLVEEFFNDEEIPADANPSELLGERELGKLEVQIEEKSPEAWEKMQQAREAKDKDSAKDKLKRAAQDLEISRKNNPILDNLLNDSIAKLEALKQEGNSSRSLGGSSATTHGKQSPAINQPTNSPTTISYGGDVEKKASNPKQ